MPDFAPGEVLSPPCSATDFQGVLWGVRCYLRGQVAGSWQPVTCRLLMAGRTVWSRLAVVGWPAIRFMHSPEYPAIPAYLHSWSVSVSDPPGRQKIHGGFFEWSVPEAASSRSLRSQPSDRLTVHHVAEQRSLEPAPRRRAAAVSLQSETGMARQTPRRLALCDADQSFAAHRCRSQHGGPRPANSHRCSTLASRRVN